MNKDFEWLKWLGLIVFVCIVGAFIYIKKSDAPPVEKEKPSASKANSFDQTNNLIERLEQLMATDSSVNVEDTPKVAEQSRKYNAFLEEAESIYGGNDIANPYRYCTSMVVYARELWSLKYTPTNMTEEYINKSQKRFFDAYEDAKKGCLEKVAESQN